MKNLWWCLTVDNVVVQHVTDAYANHSGHVRCVEVGFDDVARPEPEEGT